MVESSQHHPPIATAPRLCARLLGPAVILVGDRLIDDSEWPRRSARTLLLMLLSTPGHTISRERVREELWPEASPESAANALALAIHALRRVLEPNLTSGRLSSYIDSTAATIRIRPQPGAEVDVDDVERALSTTGQGDRRAHLQHVAGAYQGELLGHEPDANWAIGRRESLRRGWERAMLELVELDHDAGDPLASESLLLRMVRDDPLNEPAHAALVRSYLAAGWLDKAVGQYQACSIALRTELGVGPSAELDNLMADIHGLERANARRSPGIHSLFRAPAPPYPTIGREREMRELEAIFTSGQSRLVTLTGAGGIGKTHLAMVTGAKMANRFADGVLFVPLAALHDRAEIVAALARLLGIREDRQSDSLEERLLEALQHHRLLLVLDNFEHLLDAASLPAELLATTSGISILITSREALRLRGERVFRIEPLASLPSSQVATAEQTAASPAEVFFLARVVDSDSTFTLTSGNAPQIVEICRRLAGIPLALELAATWVRRLSLAEIVEHLSHPLALLVDGPRDLPVRHQTMRNAIAWSCDLLDSDERQALDICSIFSDGCSSSAALFVIANTMRRSRSDVARMIDHLVDCHLLIRQPLTEQSSRIMMLETIQGFAAEGLAAHGSGDAARDFHAEWFLAQTEAWARLDQTLEQETAGRDVARELGNLRTAFQWSIETNPSVALRLSIASWRIFEQIGLYQEGIDWLEHSLAKAGAARSPLIAQASYGAGCLLHLAGELDRAHTHFTRVESLSDQDGTNALAGRIETTLGIMAYYRGDYSAALDRIERGWARCTAVGDIQGAAEALLEKPSCLFFLRRRAEALRLIPVALRAIESAGDRRRLARALSTYGMLLGWVDDTTTAGKLLARALHLGIELGDIDITARARMRLGEIQGYAGRFALARELCSEALVGFRQTGRIVGIAGSLFYRGLFSVDLPGAVALDDLTESLHLWQRIGAVHTLDCLQAIATIAIERNHAETGLILLAAVDAYRQANQLPLRLKRFQQLFSNAVVRAREQLGPAEFDPRWQAGATMAIEDAIAEALVFVTLERSRVRT